ncbi:hypothetical protein [uncultured Microbacterium sp.]|uniref:hypothetical protein n=1 Tax=uncultured Microbacterium sp. TaxID=191216 RepID=UPI0028D0A393|nr:hypothetical protein [uncultured Microbacterium sp.]
MITTPVRDDIRAFAAEVRAHLDDLPADEVDDLLDGLEADLSDQAAEAGDDFGLPDATTYADELRSAAGLPDRVLTPKKKLPLVRRARAAWNSTGRRIRGNPAGTWILDTLASLRPVWWVVRGVVVYLWVVSLLVPLGGTGGILSSLLALTFNPLAWIILLGLIAVSVQWGQGRWMPFRWLHATAVVVSAVTVLALPATLGMLSNSLFAAVYDNRASASQGWTPGLSVDGIRVRNIYAYDANGAALSGVQLFDQDGRPVTTVGMETTTLSDAYYAGGGGPVPVPYTVPGSAPIWNAFPLREVPAEKWTWDQADLAEATLSPVPFERVQPLPDAAQPALQASPTPEPSTAPSAESTPIPTADPLGPATPEAVAP